MSVAVIVTVTGPAGPSTPLADQLQVPFASFFVTVPKRTPPTVEAGVMLLLPARAGERAGVGD